MMRSARQLITLLMLAATMSTGCDWRGVNSLSLPGTAGGGPGSYEVQAQLPDVTNIQPNSRVRVGDVMVGNVTKIERQGWHALVTMRLDGDVNLPENATAKIGQTSVFGSLHVELAPPAGVVPQGRLHNGSLIPLASTGAYPNTEQTLAAVAMLLNGGGLGRAQEITKELSTAFTGREQDLRSLLDQINQFVGHVRDQQDDIIAASDSLDRVAGQFAAQQPVMDAAVRSIPDALAVLNHQRDKLVEAFDRFGKFNAVSQDLISRTRDKFVQELKDLGPVLDSLGNAGPALTRSLSAFTTYPWINETVPNWFRGDYANLTLILDLTLSRLDTSFFTGTRWEGDLTRLEMQWGRTIGQLPSPATIGNPLVVPYHLNQGP